MSGLLDDQKFEELSEIAARLRIHSIKGTNVTQSGHPTSCASAAEIMSVLFFHTMRYDAKHPNDPSSDRFVLSKGHAAPVLYGAWAEVGYVSTTELWTKMRKIDSDLEGHPTPRLAFVDVATGSLGQGLSCAAGMAYSGKYFDKASYRVYCLMGDGEVAEGSVWEAFMFAKHNQLNNLVAILDVNRLGQSDPTMLQHQIDMYEKRANGFGWHTEVVDGHDIRAVAAALEVAQQVNDKPTVIIAKTFKGHDFPAIENLEDWHGKALGQKSDAVLQHLLTRLKHASKLDDAEKPFYPNFKPLAPVAPLAPAVSFSLESLHLSEPPKYQLGQELASRAAYGTALAKLGAASDRIVALDGDVKNSTFSIKFKEKFPERFVECYIAEQDMVGIAGGIASRLRYVPFCSTFAAFFSRAYDQIRMSGVSNLNIKFCGSHSGVSIGEDGQSQMGLEDLSMFRSVIGSVVLYPTEAVSAERAVELAARHRGVVYIRTSRPNTPVLYSNDENFAIGKAKVVKKSDADVVTVVGAGITLSEALKAYEKLKKEGVSVTVVDLFSVKPVDRATLVEAVTRTKGRLVTVEDHYEEGGIGEAVLSALFSAGDGGALTVPLHYRRLAVHKMSHSAKPTELLRMHELDAEGIEKAIRSLL